MAAYYLDGLTRSAGSPPDPLVGTLQLQVAVHRELKRAPFLHVEGRRVTRVPHLDVSEKDLQRARVVAPAITRLHTQRDLESGRRSAVGLHQVGPADETRVVCRGYRDGDLVASPDVGFGWPEGEEDGGEKNEVVVAAVINHGSAWEVPGFMSKVLVLLLEHFPARREREKRGA